MRRYIPTNMHDEYSEKHHLWCAKRWREIIEEMAALTEEVDKYEQEYGEELEEKRTKHSHFSGNTFSPCCFSRKDEDYQ